MCTRPIIRTIRDAYGRATVQHLPCGKCPDCLCDKQNSWKLRLIEEASNWRYMYFFTLTYCDEAIPLTDDGLTQVDKRHIQGWLKRFRTRYERATASECRFKYFIASEYAPDGFYTDRRGNYRRSTMRPHYHGVIFTDIPESVIKGTLFYDWRKLYGFYKLDLIESERKNFSSVANYVSKYCCKGCFASRQEEIRQGLINNTFNLMSKGIGISYVDKNRYFHTCGACPDTFVTSEVLDKIIASRFVSDGPFKYKMPRYWKDRIFKSPFIEYGYRWDKESMSYVKKKVKRYSSSTPLSMQIAAVLQERFAERIAESLREFELFKKAAPDSSVDFFGTNTVTVAAKERRKYLRLKSFYDSSAHRNSSLCFSNI